MSTDAVFSSFEDSPFKDEKPIRSEDDIPVTDSELPMYLREGQYDVVLVNCEKDAAIAELVKQILEKFVTLEDGNKAEISTLDITSPTEFVWIQSKFDTAEEAMARCTFMFLFMTEHFIKDEWAKLMQEECIQKSIDDPNRKWCVVPLYPQPKSECTYKIPWGLRSVKGLYINKMLRRKTLNDVKFEDVKEDHLDPYFLEHIAKLLNSKLSLKLNRMSSQAYAVEKFKNELMVERKKRLMEYKANQKITESKQRKELELQQEIIDNIEQGEIRKIEAMEGKDLPDNIRKRIIGERHPAMQASDTNLLNKLQGQVHRRDPSDVRTCAKEANSTTTQARSDPPDPVVSQTIIFNIRSASGLMIGDRNVQCQTQPQSLEAQEIQDCQYDSTGEEHVEIERTSEPQEGRDDKPEECETNTMKLKTPVENTEHQIPVREHLTVSLLSDVTDKPQKGSLVQYTGPSSPAPKPVAAVTPTIHEDTKIIPVSGRPRPYDPDQTRVKSHFTPGQHWADETVLKRVVLSSTEHSTESQESSQFDETHVKALANTAEEESHADDTLVKTVESSVGPEEWTPLDETEVKQIAVTEQKTTEVKTPHAEEEKMEKEETLVKEEYRVRATSSGQPQRESYLDETLLKTVEGELIEQQPDEYAISMQSAAHIRENGSSVDPASYWRDEGGNDLSEPSSNSSTLVPSVSSSCSDKTLVPET